MIVEYIFEKFADISLSYISKLLAETRSLLLSNPKDIQDAINEHLGFVKTWCDEVSFRDLKKAKQTEKIYVIPDIYLYRRRIRVDSDEEIEAIPLVQMFGTEHKHIVLLGQPGAGKTTSMKYLCSKIIFDGSFQLNLCNFPVVIQFRDLNVRRNSDDNKSLPLSSVSRIIFKQLYHIFGLNIQFGEFFQGTEKNDEGARRLENLMERMLVKLLDDLQVLLVLDGFDELTFAEDREIALAEIRTLTSKLQNSTVVVTSRTGEFPFNIENSNHFEMCPLNKDQIRIFSHKWLEDPEKAAKFVKEIANSPFSDTTIRPLTLAHLCAIYERSGKIPDRPKTVYRRIVSLLLDEWDEQRSVRRMSRYANFESDRKFEFLCNLAYELTTSFNKTIFSGTDLLHIYTKIYDNYDLLKNEATKVVDELESHNGLFVQTGYQFYEFAHKSLQEYLTAEYIVKLPKIPEQPRTLSKLPNELAISITISSNPSAYFSELVFNRFCKNKFPASFYGSFVTRLVQEKPDFNKLENVIIALLVVYSFYLDESLDTGQMRMFYQDDLVLQFEKFIRMLSKRNSGKVFSTYYQVQGDVNHIGNMKIYALQKTKDLKDFNLPTTLYARESFFEFLGGVD